MWTVDETVSRFRFVSNAEAYSLPLARSPLLQANARSRWARKQAPDDSKGLGEHRRGGTSSASQLTGSGARKQRACAECATLPSAQPPAPLADEVG